MGVALPLEKMSQKEKINAMESLWDDLCRHAEGIESPDWHGTLLGKREESLTVGEAEFIDREDAKKRISGRIQVTRNNAPFLPRKADPFVLFSSPNIPQLNDPPIISPLPP